MQAQPSDAVRDHVLKSLEYSARVGTAAGLVGLTGGSIYGFLSLPRGFAFGAAVGVTGFYHGTFITLTRRAFLDALPAAQQEKTPAKIIASGTAGCISGAVAGLWQRGPALRHSAIVGLLSVTTQLGYNFLYSRYAKDPDLTPFLERVANSPWMPLRSVPDEEYEAIIQGRINKLGAEISSVEAQIAVLQQRKASLSKGP